ncbi:MAG: outer membrane beta-barrel protein [Nitrospiraceae bacterium]
MKDRARNFRRCWLSSGVLASMLMLAGPLHAEDVRPDSSESGGLLPGTSTTTEPTQPPSSLWHYGAYLDVSYIVNFNFPENHLWRSRTTAARHNELAPNMVLGYVRKDATVDSRWGTEFGLQGGYDSKDFAFLPGESKVGGADTLRHIHRANASYLAPVGNGLTITAGLFNSLIGYESLYAKDNFNYTRSWIADNTPYMMFGINAKYPVNDQVTVAGFIINGYYHLAHPNDQPSYGTQVAWKPTSRLTVTETLYFGPDQANTSLQFWRLYLNNVVEYKWDEVTITASYDAGTEEIAGRPGSPRAFVMGGNVAARWRIAGPWSAALRPEFYWDRNGRWTGNEQFVKAMTTTLEYAAPYGWTNTRLRLEYRWDESTGANGGFFKRGDIQPGVPGLTASQHLVLLGLLWTFDSP